MDKFQVAHEWAMKFGKSTTIMDRENTVDYAWEYADAMQAEADKRKESGFPDELKDETGKIIAVRVGVEQWQPDWSVAPEWANWWAIDADGIANWFDNKPNMTLTYLALGDAYQACVAPSFNYQGDWRNSLRKRQVID